MANILIAWELGTGLGHLLPLRDVASELIERGHQVAIAFRELHNVFPAFSRMPIRIFQAPFHHSQTQNAIHPAATFAHILHNTGFSDHESLISLGKAWQSIYSATMCDLAVFDHSPTALLASRKFDFRKVVFGSGFSIPTSISPMPNMRNWLHVDKARIADDESRVLAVANLSLRTLGGRPLSYLHELYSQAEETLAITYPELDLFPERANPHYVGFWLTMPNSACCNKENAHPALSRPKVFAYLKPFRSRDRVLQSLAESGLPSVVYLPDSGKQQNNCGSICFVNRPINLRDVLSHQCVVLGNGNFGTLVQAALWGCPTLSFPLTLDQRLHSEKVQSLGMGLSCDPGDSERAAKLLSQILEHSDYRIAATEFQAKHNAGNHSEANLSQVVRRICNLL